MRKVLSSTRTCSRTRFFKASTGVSGKGQIPGCVSLVMSRCRALPALCPFLKGANETQQLLLRQCPVCWKKAVASRRSQCIENELANVGSLKVQPEGNVHGN